MRWGIAFLVKEPTGTIVSFTVEHNLTNKEEVRLVAEEAKRAAAEAGYNGIVWSFTHMLDHEGPAAECAACHAAIEESLAKEKARGGTPSATTPPPTG